jgi:pimeloyl-ACP methyl ester carboxylesterase
MARLPDALRVDLPDAGHLLTTERPDAIADACLALARRVLLG